MTERRYKYRREDFHPLPVRLEHMKMYISFFEDRVDATNCLTIVARHELQEITLDAKELIIHSVQWCHDATGEGGVPVVYHYDKERDKLVVELPCPVKPSERFYLKTVSSCIPSDHILEGIYKDTTPPGAPQQFMSQCQQWGFQRIMPVFDDCTAKCTMTTTIEADSRYTHLISNGDINRITNPEGVPVPKPGDPGRQIITYENRIPMAPYLFIVCAGTWDTLVDSVTYPSGRSVRLEYLVPPGMTHAVRIPMDILKQAILWVEKTQQYEYKGETYRTICMNKSNFGGMENVGNTTIVTDAAIITEHTLDSGLLYAHAVIVHEFEHNQCGSETTMLTPFDVWLNEAYTVDVERQFMADVFNPSYIRLNQVESIRHPLLGPLAIEDSGYVGRIVREGFNNPEELIDSVTYVKAAEVIRMLRLILGVEKFREGKTLYFSRYHNSNADTEQFFACFEEVSGVDLRQFREGWLYRAGYPKVSAETSYDEQTKRYTIRFEQQVQQGQMPFYLPIQLALVDRQGQDLPGSVMTFHLKDTSAELVFENIPEEPAFASLNRDYSFYGTFVNRSATEDTLISQVKLDCNRYSKVDAFQRLTDIERITLIKDPRARISNRWLALYGELIDNATLPSSVKAFMLRIDEQPHDRAYLTWYQEQVTAREKLMKSVNAVYRDQLLHQFRALDTYSPEKRLLPHDGIEDRMLKNILLELITIDDTPESHALLVEHYRCATTATDKVAALTLLNRSSAPMRRQLLEEVYAAWHQNLSGYANYLRVISAGTCEDVFSMIEAEKRRPTFDITQPTWQRALFLPMAVNNKMLWSDAGIAWLTDTIIELASINMTTASRLLNTFQHARNLRPALKPKVLDALARIVSSLPEAEHPALHNQARAYLGG